MLQYICHAIWYGKIQNFPDCISIPNPQGGLSLSPGPWAIYRNHNCSTCWWHDRFDPILPQHGRIHILLLLLLLLLRTVVLMMSACNASIICDITTNLIKRMFGTLFSSVQFRLRSKDLGWIHMEILKERPLC